MDQNKRFHKMRVKNLIINQIKSQSKLTEPVNSAKSSSVRYNEIIHDLSTPLKHISLKALNPRRGSIDLRHLSKNSSTSKEPLLYSKKHKKSYDAFNYQAPTKTEIHRTLESTLAYNSSNPVLAKHKKLFDLINCPDLVRGPSLEKIDVQIDSITKSSIEKVLHEDYVKDQTKTNRKSIFSNSQKKLWRPDSTKTLKRADKTLRSLTKFINH